MKKTYKEIVSILLLTILLLSSLSICFTFIIPVKADAGWWDTDWNYYKSLSINNPVNSYQMKINVTKYSGGNISCHGLCKDDFGDIRFLDIDNTTVLPYWIESLVSGFYTIMWINVSSDVVTDGKILMYYGNPLANNISNGDDTFLFFDDFSNSTINTTKWNTAGTPTVSDGILELNSDVEYVKSKATWDRNVATRFRANVCNLSTNHDTPWIGFSDISNYLIGFQANDHTTGQVYGCSYVSGYAYTSDVNPVNQWHIYDTSWMTNSGKFWCDNGYITELITQIPSSALPLTAYGYDTYGGHTFVDWIIVRSYSSLEPTWGSVSGEGTWIQVTNNANWSPRTSFSALTYDNKMWVIGGSNSSGYCNDIWYSIDGINWSMATEHASWAPRDAFVGLVYDNKMWVIGGTNGSSNSDNFNDVWYSTDGANWTEATNNSAMSGRAFASGIVYDNKMWVMGGDDSTSSWLNDVWYSTDGSSWTRATEHASWSGRDVSAMLVYDNKMWIMGGQILPNIGLNDIWYSTNGVTWNQATANANWSDRYNIACAVYDNKMWLMGGNNLGSTYTFNDVWLSTDSINWTENTTHADWGKRANPRSLVYNNKIWIIGGSNSSGYLNDVWYLKYNIITNYPPNQPTNEVPANNSDYITPETFMNVTVSDPDGDNMSVTFKWQNSTTIATLFGITNNSVASIWLPDYLWIEHDIDYSWYVNVSDGLDSITSPVWNFHTSKAWDLNGDRDVNYLDVSSLVSHYGESVSPPASKPWDIDSNGVVNYLDVSSLVSHYGEVY